MVSRARLRPRLESTLHGLSGCADVRAARRAPRVRAAARLLNATFAGLRDRQTGAGLADRASHVGRLRYHHDPRDLSRRRTQTFGPQAALATATIVTFSTIRARSKYATTDAATTFWLTIVLWLVLRVIRLGRGARLAARRTLHRLRDRHQVSRWALRWWRSASPRRARWREGRSLWRTVRDVRRTSRSTRRWSRSSARRRTSSSTGTRPRRTSPASAGFIAERRQQRRGGLRLVVARGTGNPAALVRHGAPLCCWSQGWCGR